MAQLDLSGGPLVLEVPEAAGRYYVLQFVSAWTKNFAYVGNAPSAPHRDACFSSAPGTQR